MPTDPAAPRPPAAPLADQSKIEIQKSKIQRLLAYRLLFGLAVVILILDQLTKLWIVHHVPFDPYHSHRRLTDITVIRGFFYIIHVGNPGAAWSMLSGQSVLLAWIAAATLMAIAWWRHALGLRESIAQIAFGVLCGGIVGNLVDRIAYGHVIDFIDLHFGSYIYPTFNVADSGICVGVFLYLWQNLRGPK
jgi:signal peptidase II